MSYAPALADERRTERGPARAVDVALRDGSTVRVQPVSVADEARIAAFLHGLSERSRQQRFFSAGANLADQARRKANLDLERDYGLIATAGASGEIVGHAGYSGGRSGCAEVAFVIADAYQGRGLATMLLAHLATHARAHGVTTFTAITGADNHGMIDVFRGSGFPVEVRSGMNTVSISLPTELTPEGWERFEQRDRIASVGAVDAILAPQSVAVIGASHRRGTVGAEILHNVVANDFQGVVYPINPTARFVQSMLAYASVGELPSAVDLAVIAVPAAGVLDVARQCGEAGVRGLVVVSAGFAEVGEEGASAQRELLEICRAYGMRIVGPNCIGVLNTAPEVQLDATFIALAPRPGHIGFLSQSGGLGIAIVQAAQRLRIGLSAFVSVGNKVDLSGNDFIQYWEQDPNTNVILLYLESFGNARKFSRVARRVGRTKPIVAVKSGRSAAGARASSSHTGALLASSDVTVDALFRQAGVIRTDTLGELFDVAALLTDQPAPRGRRVVILTNGGGPGILAADACEAAGLEVVELPAKLREELRASLPAEASVANPIDVIATASADHFRGVIETVARAEVADSLIVIYVPTLVTEARDVAAGVSAAARTITPELTLASVFMVEEDLDLQRGERLIPRFAFPEDAARALGHAARYGAWREAPAGNIPVFDGLRSVAAAAVIARALGTGAGWLEAQDVATLLDCYGIPTPAARFAAGAREAAAAAGELGGTVALKAIAPGLVHKSDVGAVAIGLRPAQVQRAATKIATAVAKAGFKVEGFHVQAMAPPGVELIVGVVQDPAFGPLIAAGAGGTSTELLGDLQARLTPLSDIDAHEMIRSLRLFPLLDGYRGAARCDVEALEELLLRVSALVEAHPEVAEMDLNPVVALPDGVLAIDARVRVDAAPAVPVRPSVKG
jgi:acetyl coenzyme A synthetase (ADP forming)-like protein